MTLHYKIDGRMRSLTIMLDKYENGNIAVTLYTKRGEPFADLTVNICELPKGLACIDINNFPEAIDLIKEYDLGKFTNNFVQSGFCQYPVYVLNMENLEKYA